MSGQDKVLSAIWLPQRARPSEYHGRMPGVRSGRRTGGGVESMPNLQITL